MQVLLSPRVLVLFNTDAVKEVLVLNSEVINEHAKQTDGWDRYQADDQRVGPSLPRFYVGPTLGVFTVALIIFVQIIAASVVCFQRLVAETEFPRQSLIDAIAFLATAECNRLV